jgi:ERCC4-type nuclease
VKVQPIRQLNPHLGELKPYRFPQGFVLVVDTREQTPLFDPKPDGLKLIHGKLDHGDYSVKGFEDRFAIERKMLSDLCAYVARERKKTKFKMEYLSTLDFAALVIEESEEEVFFGHMMSRVSPESIRQALVSFRVRYGVHVYMHKSRDHIERFVLDHAIKFYNVMREVC